MAIEMRFIADDVWELAQHLRAAADLIAPLEEGPPDTTAGASVEAAAAGAKFKLEAEIEVVPAAEAELGAEVGPAAKTKRRKAAPKDEEPKDEEPKDEEPKAEDAPETGQATPASEEKDWNAALELLTNVYTNGDEARKQAVRDLLAGFGAARFRDVPKERGPELLAAAKAL